MNRELPPGEHGAVLAMYTIGHMKGRFVTDNGKHIAHRLEERGPVTPLGRNVWKLTGAGRKAAREMIKSREAA